MTFSPTPGCPQSICNMFSVTPSSGMVGPSDKPLAVTICVVPSKEMNVKEQPILQCRVIEPRRISTTTVLSESVQSSPSFGDALANIPIRVSCQSSYSRHLFCCSSRLHRHHLSHLHYVRSILVHILHRALRLSTNKTVKKWNEDLFLKTSRSLKASWKKNGST